MSLLAKMLIALILAAACLRQPAPADESAPSAQPGIETTPRPAPKPKKPKLNTPESAYREALRLESELRRAWQRNPEYDQLVGRRLAELRSALNSLCDLYRDRSDDKRPASDAPNVQQSSTPTSPQPAGGAPAEGEVDAADAAERRERALDETHRAPSPEQMKLRAARRIAQAPPDWVRKKCREGSALLRDLEFALTREKVDQERVAALLKKLQGVIAEMPTPPKAPSARPKSSEDQRPER